MMDDMVLCDIRTYETMAVSKFDYREVTVEAHKVLNRAGLYWLPEPWAYTHRQVACDSVRSWMVEVEHDYLGKLKEEVEELRELNVQRLELKVGDLLVLETPHVLSRQAVERIRDSVKKVGEEIGVPDLKAVILEDGIRLAKLLRADR